MPRCPHCTYGYIRLSDGLTGVCLRCSGTARIASPMRVPDTRHVRGGRLGGRWLSPWRDLPLIALALYVMVALAGWLIG